VDREAVRLRSDLDLERRLKGVETG
jgi:hypothetical protein